METRLYQSDETGIAAAAKLLAAGEVVALPTETVYGLAADVTNLEAVKKIFVAKQRPLFDPLIVHVPVWDLAQLDEVGIIDLGSLSDEMQKRAGNALKAFWPGPFTMLLPRGKNISEIVTAGSDLVAVRAPNHPVFQSVLSALGRAVAAPSANLFGHVSPTSADHVRVDLDGRIAAILDGGATTVGLESTIVKLADRGFNLLRPGGIGLNDLSVELGELKKQKLLRQ